MTKSTNFCEKNLEIIKMVFFIKKIMKIVPKNISVFGGLTFETSEHTKTFFNQMFYFVC